MFPDIDRLVWVVMWICALVFAGLIIMIAIDLLWPGPKKE